MSLGYILAVTIAEIGDSPSLAIDCWLLIYDLNLWVGISLHKRKPTRANAQAGFRTITPH